MAVQLCIFSCTPGLALLKEYRISLTKTTKTKLRELIHALYSYHTSADREESYYNIRKLKMRFEKIFNGVMFVRAIEKQLYTNSKF